MMIAEERYQGYVIYFEPDLFNQYIILWKEKGVESKIVPYRFDTMEEARKFIDEQKYPVLSYL